MSSLSQTHRLLAAARAARHTLDTLGRSASGSRFPRQRQILGALASGTRTTFRAVGRSLRALWLQVTGLFFFAFALVGSMAAVRQYRHWAATHTSFGRFLLACAFAITFAWFAGSSFWSAGHPGRGNGRSRPLGQ